MNTPMDNFRRRIGGFAFGGDYNPEQWPRETWQEDVALMKQAGVNLVTLGVFAWASIEPEPGRFEFEWMDDVLELLHSKGISVDLATPTMAPPIWLSKQFPESLPEMEDGNAFGFGNRLHFDPTSPHYRDAAARVTTALAERYSHHPALAMWHISNEFGPTAYNAQTSIAFRGWLQRRYGSLEALNDAWYTRFWSQVYSDWDEVDVPAVPRAWSNPARRLDFKRFISDALLECYVAERDIVKAHRSDIPVLTNYMRFYKTADYWKWAPEQDAVALDIYPNPGDPESHVSAALNYDLMRSLRGESWVLMEQAASSVSQWKVNNVKRPGMMRLGSYQAIAHGADSVLYFQWRASRGGHERFHSAMLPHSGTLARSWREIEQLGNELPLVADAIGSTSTAQVAQLFDWNVWWGLTETHGLPRNDFDYPMLQTEHYRPLWERNIGVDFVSLGSDLNPYRLVVVPHAYLVDDHFVHELTRFVEAGGTVLCTFFSGVVDERNQVRQPAYPGGLRHLIGAYIDEYWPARDSESFELDFADGTTARSEWWQDSLTVETASVLASYRSGELAGRPAVIENRVGSGRVVYVGTKLDAADFDRLLGSLASDAGVRPVIEDASPAIEATLRSTADAEFLFLLNHSDDEQDVALAHPALDLLTGTEVTDRITVPARGVAILRRHASSD